ncbi:dihydropteroate synthase [candidate division KSB1 bacterium]|nr:dihydropteroate synthase [candidate division KSB1 bacterium]RQW05155.1 MAG: dihydropteroate synthase [candidate division KSB1 bacterium]
MGILNVTPDSFSDGGRYNNLDSAFNRAIQMQEQGADIIDIGGESTRPGAAQVSEREELERVIPVIKKCRTHLHIPMSIDTYKATVAEHALAAGAVIVNDISGCRFDARMPHVVNQYQAGLVIMHIKGEPKNMQVNPFYKDLFDELIKYFEKSIRIARAAGVTEEQIVIDPGIGFGKRLKDNFQLLRELRIFEKFGRPILVGPSRKSFIGRLLDLPEEKRLEGSIAAVTAAILNGAHIVRVHDVQEIKRAVTIADAIAGKINVGD